MRYTNTRLLHVSQDSVIVVSPTPVQCAGVIPVDCDMVLGARGSVHPRSRPDSARAAQRLSASVRTPRISASDVAASSQRNGRRYACLNRRYPRRTGDSFLNVISINFVKQKLSYRKQIARQRRTQYVECIYGPKFYTVTLKSRLRVTQGHWKQPLDRSYTTYNLSSYMTLNIIVTLK